MGRRDDARRKNDDDESGASAIAMDHCRSRCQTAPIVEVDGTVKSKDGKNLSSAKRWK